MRIFLGLIIIMLVILSISCGDKDSTPLPPKDNIITTHTIMGAEVQSINIVSDEVKSRIDQQLTRLFEIGNSKGYKGFSWYDKYRIIIRPRESVCEEAGYRLDDPYLNYDGSIWDKDPRPNYSWVCAAGNAEVNNGYYDIITTEDGIKTSLIVGYEGEHHLLRECNPSLYQATKYHTVTSGHPIFGDKLWEGLR